MSLLDKYLKNGDMNTLQIYMVQNIILVWLTAFGISLCLRDTRFLKKSMVVMLGLNI